MCQNFDDYSDFQKIPGMPILLQHSVYETLPSKRAFNFIFQASSWSKGFCLKEIQEDSFQQHGTYGILGMVIRLGFSLH
jgi:hypothetical protein